MWTARTIEEYDKYCNDGVDAIIFEGFEPEVTKTM